MGDQHSAAELSKALLGLYECAVTPETYPAFTRDLGNLLAEGADPSTVMALETHAEAIWAKSPQLLAGDRVVDIHKNYLFQHICDQKPNHDFSIFMDQLLADDCARLRSLMSHGPTHGKVLVRAECKKSLAVELYLARRHDNRVSIFRLKNDLATEVGNLLKSQFNITQAELAVVKGLISGLTLKELAQTNGKSIETIRSQVKSTAGKLGLSRQTEIAATVFSISKFAQSDPGTSSNDLASITLPDNRKLFYAALGDPAGRPVVFFHDFSSSCRWPQTVAQQFQAHGRRLISVARAGFGPSDVNLKSQKLLFESHVDDYAELMDQLGLGACDMLAFGTGFGIAHALCRREPSRLKQLVGLNTYPPILSRHDAMCFPPGMYRAGALAAIYAPRTCSLVSRYAARRAAGAQTIDELDQLTGHVGENNVLETRFFEDFIKPNLADVIDAKASGVWRDCTCLTIDWTRLYQRATPVRATILQNRDFPFQPAERNRDLAETIDVPFAVLDRPYRHFVQSFDDVLAYIDG